MIYTRKRELNKPILIGKIYAKWCFHCKQLIPEWKKMKTKIRAPKGRPISNLHRYNSPFEFVEIECSQKRKMAQFKQKYGNIQVNGYPTIFSKKGTEFEYYTGNRDAASLEQWVKSHKPQKSNLRRTQKRPRKLI